MQKGKDKVSGTDSSKTSEVSNGFFSSIRQMGLNAAVGVARPLITWSEDKHAKFLKQLTGQDVAALINEIAPQLPEFFRHQLSTEMADYVENNPKATHQITKALITRIVANLATSLYPDEANAFSKKQQLPKTVTLEEFSQAIFGRLTEIALEEFDKVDQKIKQGQSTSIEEDLFLPLANRLVDLMFYNKDDANIGIGKILRSFARRVSLDLSKKLLEFYRPLNLWLSSNNGTQVEPSSHESSSSSASSSAPAIDVDKLIRAAEPILVFIGENVTRKCQDEDREILQGLTGTEDVAELLNFVNPKIVDLVLNFESVQQFLDQLPIDISPLLDKHKNMVKSVSNAVLLRLISNLAQEFFADEIEQGKTVPVDKFIAKISVKLSNIFESYITGSQASRLSIDVNPFQPVAEELLKAILPKNPIVLAFFNRHQNRLTEHFALALKKSYDSIAVRNDAIDYRQRLNDLVNDNELTDQIFNFCHNVTNLGRSFIAKIFSDKTVIMEQMKASFADQDLPEEPIEGVASGVSKIVRYHKRVIKKFVEKKALTLFLSKDETKGLIESISKIPENIQSSHDKVLKHLKKDLSGVIVDTDFLDRVAHELIQDFPQNPLGWMATTIQNALQLTLFKGIVHLLEKVPNDKRQPIENLFPEALQILLDAGTEKLPAIVEGLKETDADTKELLDPLVEKLIQIFYEDEAADGLKLKDHLPIPDEMKEFVEDTIRANAHKALLPIITAFTPWIEAKEENRKRLFESFGNQHASEACRVLGAMTSRAIPYSFQEFHQSFAESFTEQFSYLFAEPGVDASPSLKPLENMVQHLIKSLAENKTSSMQALLSFVQDFSEAAFLRCFADFAELLARLEQESHDHPDGNLLVRGAIRLLDEVKEHLKTIAKVKADLKEYRAGKIDQKDFLKSFEKAGRLHPALKGGGNLEAKIEFFERLSKNIFKIVGVSKETNLPIPQFLKHPVWDAFEETLVPKLLSNLFEKIQDPHTLNLVLISLFEQINAEEDDLDVTIKDEDIRHYKDKSQDRLEKISGELIQALVQMQRSAITNWALRKEKVRTLAGQAMGQPLRKMLEEKSILEIVDDLVVSLIPSLHPGHWVTVDTLNDGTLYKKGTFLLQDQKGKQIPEPNFDHIFPREPEQKKACDRALTEAKKKAQKDVVRGIAHTIDNQTQYIFLGVFRKLWQKVRSWINKVLMKIGSARLKKVVNSFLDGVSDYLIRPFLMVTTYPTLIIVRRLLRFYFVHQSTLRAEDVNHTIHQNAIYRSIEEIIKLILNEKDVSDSKEKEDVSDGADRMSSDSLDLDDDMSTVGD
ncbi:MAG: hypothetical protein ACSNEK_01675 [Parachlamydiaceae bacterium]